MALATVIFTVKTIGCMSTLYLHSCDHIHYKISNQVCIPPPVGYLCRYTAAVVYHAILRLK